MVRWKRLTVQTSVFFCCVCIVFRFWPSDLYHWTATFAYVPGPLLAFWMLIQVCWGRTFRAAYIGLLALLLIFTFRSEMKWKCKHNENPAISLRLLHWNVWNVRRGFEKIVQTMARVDPDVIFLNEPKTSRRAPDFPPYGTGLKKYSGADWHIASGRYMLILSKFPLVEIQEISKKGYQALFAVVESPKPIRVLLLDVSPSLTNSRKLAFREIAHDVEKLDPDVVAGDFNTPSHAASLAPLLQGFWSPHCGLSYTWPSLPPLMRIDHILVRRTLAATNHSRGITLLSDHAWQAVDVP